AEPLEAAGQTIFPYTDLLLHDMGEALADGRPDFAADGREWRTPPLWGIGLLRTVNGHSDLLHDGRARNVTEAILWHGGEAEKSREAFRAMSKADRDALVKFVESL
ncbi:MAG TPA: di-heme oxidoredictase family protein, partial [Burkholderiales bacterium]|nr:di-heme oxidoredictase family protein [Burkholderiales bacterium]